MTRRPRPRRTGRGDPLGSSIQHGAGWGTAVLLAAIVLIAPIALLAGLLT